MNEFSKEQLINPIISNYLRQVYQTLNDRYSTPDGKHRQSCSTIFNLIANLCKTLGYTPLLYHVRGMKLADGINTETLVPRRFEGRVEWGGHIVCVVDGLVLDPLVGTPLTMDVYAKTTFQNPVVLIENDVFWKRK